MSGGIGPVIWLLWRSLRRQGTVAGRAGRRGRGGNSQHFQLRELADLGWDRAGDLVAVEVPATPRVGRAPRRASGARGELAAASSSRDRRTRQRSCTRHSRHRSSSCRTGRRGWCRFWPDTPRRRKARPGTYRRSGCRRAACDAEARSRAAPGVGDAGGTRSCFSAVSLPTSFGIGPVIWLRSRYLRRRGAVACRAVRRGRWGDSQLRQRREQADLGRDRAGDLVHIEAPATSRGGRAPRRASATRGERAVSPGS